MYAKITDDMTDEQKESIRAKRREAQRKWRQKNKDKVREYKREERKRNPEKFRQKSARNYWKHREEMKAKARERYRAKHPHMLPLAKMYKGEPKAPKPHPKKYHEFDRDKLAAYKMTKDERQKVKQWKARLDDLDRQYDSKAIDIEAYYNQRNILLGKIKKYDKTYISNDDE